MTNSRAFHRESIFEVREFDEQPPTSVPHQFKSRPKGPLGVSWGDLGGSRDGLGNLGNIVQALGIILESCWSAFRCPTALGKGFGIVFCKHWKTFKNIGKNCKNGCSEEQILIKNYQNTHREATVG